MGRHAIELADMAPIEQEGSEAGDERVRPRSSNEYNPLAQRVTDTRSPHAQKSELTEARKARSPWSLVGGSWMQHLETVCTLLIYRGSFLNTVGQRTAPRLTA